MHWAATSRHPARCAAALPPAFATRRATSSTARGKRSAANIAVKMLKLHFFFHCLMNHVNCALFIPEGIDVRSSDGSCAKFARTHPLLAWADVTALVSTCSFATISAGFPACHCNWSANAVLACIAPIMSCSAIARSVIALEVATNRCGSVTKRQICRMKCATNAVAGASGHAGSQIAALGGLKRLRLKKCR